MRSQSDDRTKSLVRGNGVRSANRSFSCALYENGGQQIKLNRAMQIETGQQVLGCELDGADKLWVLMLFAPVAIDYRFDDNVAGSIGLYSLVLALNVLGAWQLVMRFGLPLGNAISSTLIVSIIFAVTALFGGIVYGSDLVSLLRSGASLIVYVMVLVGIAALSRSGARPASIWRLVMTTAAAGLVFQVVMVAWLRGLDFSSLRYEVLTGGATALAALAVVATAYGGWRIRYLVYSVLVAFLVFVSVTRTYLLVSGAMLLVLVLAAPIRTLTQRSLARAAQLMPFVLIAVLAVDAIFPVSQVDRWWDRLVSTRIAHRGIDVTGLTRIGELTYQLEQLEESTIGLLIGFGPAAQTRFDDQVAALVTYLVGGDYGMIWRGGGFGHNNHFGVFYVGGIAAGTLLLLSQFLALVQVPGLLRRYGRMSNGEERLLLMAIPTALVGYMALGAFSGTMGARSSAALLGACLGMVWWLKDYRTTMEQRRTLGWRTSVPATSMNRSASN